MPLRPLLPCKSAANTTAAQHFNSLKGTLPADSIDLNGNSVGIKVGKGETSQASSVTYLCFPDTVRDPSGPKGK